MQFLLQSGNTYDVSTIAAKSTALCAADANTIALKPVAASATNVSMGDTRKLAEIAIITRAKLMAASTKAIGFAPKVH